jgi:hypothetical protein
VVTALSPARPGAARPSGLTDPRQCALNLAALRVLQLLPSLR